MSLPLMVMCAERNLAAISRVLSPETQMLYGNAMLPGSTVAERVKVLYLRLTGGV